MPGRYDKSLEKFALSYERKERKKRTPKPLPLARDGEWGDEISVVNIIAEADGWVMARRPNSLPFVISSEDFRTAFTTHQVKEGE